MNKKPSKHPHPPPHKEATPKAFRLDDEASSFAGELIAEATSAEFVREDARNETFQEEIVDLYNVDFAALDED